MNFNCGQEHTHVTIKMCWCNNDRFQIHIRLTSSCARGSSLSWQCPNSCALSSSCPQIHVEKIWSVPLERTKGNREQGHSNHVSVKKIACDYLLQDAKLARTLFSCTLWLLIYFFFSFCFCTFSSSLISECECEVSQRGGSIACMNESAS